MIALAAACASLAVFMGLRGDPRSLRRLRRSRSRGAEGASRRRASVSLTQPAVARATCAAIGLLVAVTWGGVTGILGGAVIAAAGPLVIGRLESRADVRRREALERQVAECADLLAACLASGAPLTSAAAATADALGSPIDAPLRGLADALSLGADPVAAWRTLQSEPALAPLARSAARSAETGAPLSALLAGMADDLRRDKRALADASARAAGVRAVAPLAACFLPAFFVIGVIPVVVSLALPFVAPAGS